MSKKRKYNASGIVALLESRHAKDVFVAECKDGPTHYASHLRLDGWAMMKSWAHPCAIGYEIKVSRSDFVSDNKWPAYLPLCNQFYFVAPPGVIDPAELSPDAGLLVVAGEGAGTRLLTKKKAPYRDVSIPTDLYRYILMCRVSVDPESSPIEEGRERWQKWLDCKQEDRRLGYKVSKAIRERAAAIETENGRLVQSMARYDRLLAFLENLGVDPSHWQVEEDIQMKLDARRKVFDPQVVNQLRTTVGFLSTALTNIEQMNAETNGGCERKVSHETRK